MPSKSWMGAPAQTVPLLCNPFQNDRNVGGGGKASAPGNERATQANKEVAVFAILNGNALLWKSALEVRSCSFPIGACLPGAVL